MFARIAAPVAPSTTRWSQPKVNFITLPGTTAPFLTTGIAELHQQIKLHIRRIDN